MPRIKIYFLLSGDKTSPVSITAKRELADSPGVKFIKFHDPEIEANGCWQAIKNTFEDGADGNSYLVTLYADWTRLEASIDSATLAAVFSKRLALHRYDDVSVEDKTEITFYMTGRVEPETHVSGVNAFKIGHVNHMTEKLANLQAFLHNNPKDKSRKVLVYPKETSLSSTAKDTLVELINMGVEVNAINNLSDLARYTASPSDVMMALPTQPESKTVTTKWMQRYHKLIFILTVILAVASLVWAVKQQEANTELNLKVIKTIEYWEKFYPSQSGGT